MTRAKRLVAFLVATAWVTFALGCYYRSFVSAMVVYVAEKAEHFPWLSKLLFG